MLTQSARTKWYIDYAMLIAMALVAIGVMAAFLADFRAALTPVLVLVAVILVVACTHVRSLRRSYRFIDEQITNLMVDQQWHSLDVVYFFTLADDERTMSDVSSRLKRRRVAGSLEERVNCGQFEYRNSPA